MPDEQGNAKIDTEKVPETPLHAHGDQHEDTGVEAQDKEGDDPVGEVHEGEPDASQVEKTGGGTSGGPPREDPGEDPSQV